MQGWIPFLSLDVVSNSYPLTYSNEYLRLHGGRGLCLASRGLEEGGIKGFYRGLIELLIISYYLLIHVLN